MKPKICITCDMMDFTKGKGESYLSEYNSLAIAKGGGVPILLPNDKNFIDDYLDIADGVYFTGGMDVHPMYYGEEPAQNIGTVVVRKDEFEIELYKKAFERGIPMIGVCRGSQIINVAAGGTLYQDINTQISKSNCHRQNETPGYEYFHNVYIEENSKLYNIFANTVVRTNTFHHQSVKDVADGFRVSARAADGVVEAIEYTGELYIVGVQWHPEIMFEEHEEALLIFKDFIEHCKNRK